MARDETLLLGPDAPPAALRIYGWTPATISLGYFQRYADFEALPSPLNTLAVVRRATGGGAILHDHEVTYCLVLSDSFELARKSPAELYRVAHEAWRTTLGKSGVATDLAPDEFPLPTPRTGPFFCFEKPGRTDLLLGDRKLLGSAQRRVSGRVMQHGSLILEQRYQFHPGADLQGPKTEIVTGWVESFVQELARALELCSVPADWAAQQLADADERRRKHSDESWLRRR